MVVVDSDAVHKHSTVMVILDAAGVALATVVHPGQLVHLTAFLAVLELSIVRHPIVDDFVRLEVVAPNQGVEGI